MNGAFPMFAAWGPELTVIYNNAYRKILMDRHPKAFGKPMREVWSDAWEAVGPYVIKAMNGESSYFENFQVQLFRNGRSEQGWFTYSYCPVHGDDSKVAGFICIATETTKHVWAEKLQSFRLEVTEAIRTLSDPTQIANVAIGLLGKFTQASRVLYVDIDAAKRTFDTTYDWTDGTVSSLIGFKGNLDDFGKGLIEEAYSGRTSAINDVRSDPRTCAGADGFDSIEIQALVNIPLIKEGRFVATFSIQRSSAYEWTSTDIEIAEEIAQFTWAAVERAKTQQALQAQIREEANRLKTLFESSPSPIAVVSGKDYVFELANPAYYQLVGHRDILGKPVWEALPEVAGQGFEELLDKVTKTGEPFIGRGIKLSVQREANGPLTDAYIDLLFQPLFAADGSVRTIFFQGHDVTQTYLAQAALRESQERLREGMDAARMVVWDWTLSSGSVKFSENVQEILGGTWNTVEATFSSIHPDDLEKVRTAHLQATPENSRYALEFRLIRPDNGRTLWLENRNVVIFDSQAKPVLIKGTTLDLTERKQAEEELRNAAKERDNFLAMLAHELRNPLAPISAAAELMKMVRLTPENLKATSDIIVRQVQHMTGLIDDLLDVSRVTRGLITLEKQDIDIKQVVTEAVEQARRLIESRRHYLSVHIGPESAYVLGDKKRLVQVVANLLTNAAKYTPDGGGIAIRMDVHQDVIVLCIIDNGIGMAPELLPKVFELFAQAERSADRNQGGLGIGLALVKSLVELHGGSVAGHSEGPGKGSQFTVRLPRHIKSDRHFLQRTNDEEVPNASTSLQVMVVDDNQDAATMLAMFLESLGHQVRVGHDPRKALTLAEQTSFDACLLDIGLPEMDGNELARRLRKIPGTQKSMFIAITGYGQQFDRETALAAGFDQYLVKPAAPSKVASLLERIKKTA